MKFLKNGKIATMMIFFKSSPFREKAIFFNLVKSNSLTIASTYRFFGKGTDRRKIFEYRPFQKRRGGGVVTTPPWTFVHVFKAQGTGHRAQGNGE